MAFPFFHGILDVTFRFFDENYGRAELQRYLRWLAETYFADVAEMARRGGLPALAEFWGRVFEDECCAQPNADAQVALEGEELVIRVRKCPAFVWMEQNGRRPCDCYCDQCLILGRALAEAARLEFHIQGGAGACVQRFRQAEKAGGWLGGDGGR